MASEYKRLIDPRTMGPSDAQPKDEEWDVGGYKLAEIGVRVLSAGTGGNLAFETAAVNCTAHEK